MVCEPKKFEYSKNIEENKLGGYLLNDVYFTNYIFKDKVGYGSTTVIDENNCIVDTINGLSKTPYKINKDTLKYIYKYGIKKNILIDWNVDELKSFNKDPYKGFNNRDSKKLRAIVSKILLEKNILSIAQTYSEVDKIYFPVCMDNRTRIYCDTDYFDYQKSDLAKGLISFAIPGRIYKYSHEAIKYFKAFGANMFGNGLDKKSLNFRVNWVDENSNKILDFFNNDIVNKAENKATFVSFCFEYKRFVEFFNNKNTVVFYTYLPIQLDASCNGYQHLVLLTKESSLFNKLNLDVSTHDDNPDDFYSYILDKLNQYIHKQIEKLSSVVNRTKKQENLLNSFKLLVQLCFDRAIVKKTIMTDSYKASIPTKIDNITKNLNEHFDGKKEYYTYKDPNLKISRHDILIYNMALKEVLNIESPRISELSKYLDSIAIIYTKLNLPIPWSLPHGAKIQESYLVEEKKKNKSLLLSLNIVLINL